MNVLFDNRVIDKMVTALLTCSKPRKVPKGLSELLVTWDRTSVNLIKSIFWKQEAATCSDF